MSLPAAQLILTPSNALESQSILLRGTGWPDCPLGIEFAGSAGRAAKAIQGYPCEGGVRPTNGDFAVRLATYGLKPGRYEVRVTGRDIAETDSVLIHERKRPTLAEAKGDVNLTHWRDLAFFERRFAHIGYVPKGIISARMRSLACLRGRRKHPFSPHYSPPVSGETNWTPAGPAPT